MHTVKKWKIASSVLSIWNVHRISILFLGKRWSFLHFSLKVIQSELPGRNPEQMSSLCARSRLSNKRVEKQISYVSYMLCVSVLLNLQNSSGSTRGSSCGWAYASRPSRVRTPWTFLSDSNELWQVVNLPKQTHKTTVFCKTPHTKIGKSMLAELLMVCLPLLRSYRKKPWSV